MGIAHVLRRVYCRAGAWPHGRGDGRHPHHPRGGKPRPGLHDSNHGGPPAGPPRRDEGRSLRGLHTVLGDIRVHVGHRCDHHTAAGTALPGVGRRGGGPVGAVRALPDAIVNINLGALAIAAVTLVVGVVWPSRLGKFVPSTLAALVAGTLLGVLWLTNYAGHRRGADRPADPANA